MARKVFIELKVQLVVNMDDDLMVSKVMDELHYDILLTTRGADLENAEIIDWEITDSK